MVKILDTGNLFSGVAGPFFFWPLYRLATEEGDGGVGSLLIKGAGAQESSASLDSDVVSMLCGNLQEGAPFSLNRSVKISGPGHEALLAKALTALAVFSEALRGSWEGGGSSVGYVSALLTLFWKFKTHLDSLVRRSALALLSAAIAGVHEGGDVLLLSPSVLVFQAPHELGLDSSVLDGGVSSQEAPPINSLLLQKLGSAVKGPGSSLRIAGLTLEEDKESSTTAQAMELMSTPRIWDDLVLCVGWLKEIVTGGSGKDADPIVMANAAALLNNAILQELIVGPLEGI
jgi:hypothetical protein